jgi:hypothetical protein
MSRYAVWPILSLSALCSAASAEEPGSAPRGPSRRDVRVEQPRTPEEPARVETTVGTFEVNVKNAELLGRMIAGEKVPVQFYAGTD